MMALIPYIVTRHDPANMQAWHNIVALQQHIQEEEVVVDVKTLRKGRCCFRAGHLSVRIQYRQNGATGIIIATF